MKIFLQLPNGTKFCYHCDKRPPMDDGHFYALCVLIGFVAFFGLLMLSTVLR